MGESGGGLNRRVVLQGAVALVASAVVPLRWAPRAGAVPNGSPAFLRAYVSTLVPGPADDPAGSPGGVEAGGVDAILEHAPYVVPILGADLLASSLAPRHRRRFEQLTYPEREALLGEAFAGPRAPYHLIALALGAGAFYGDFYAARGIRVGGAHLGFPGPSDGYLGTYTDRSGHGQPQAAAVPP